MATGSSRSTMPSSERTGEDGYGVLKSPDRLDIHFHRNSVINGDLDVLSVGDRLAFVDALGEKGAQASTVRALGNHRKA